MNTENSSFDEYFIRFSPDSLSVMNECKNTKKINGRKTLKTKYIIDGRSNN